jgi:hypothetical protein
VPVEALPDQSPLVKARALRARLRRLAALTSVARPGVRRPRAEGSARARGRSSRYGASLAADKLAPLSGWSPRAAGTPWLIIKNLDQDERERWGRYRMISGITVTVHSTRQLDEVIRKIGGI